MINYLKSPYKRVCIDRSQGGATIFKVTRKMEIQLSRFWDIWT